MSDVAKPFRDLLAELDDLRAERQAQRDFFTVLAVNLAVRQVVTGEMREPSELRELLAPEVVKELEDRAVKGELGVGSDGFAHWRTERGPALVLMPEDVLRAQAPRNGGEG